MQSTLFFFDIPLTGFGPWTGRPATEKSGSHLMVFLLQQNFIGGERAGGFELRGIQIRALVRMDGSSGFTPTQQIREPRTYVHEQAVEWLRGWLREHAKLQSAMLLNGRQQLQDHNPSAACRTPDRRLSQRHHATSAPQNNASERMTFSIV
jgi:hypothetical protein